MTGTAPQQIPVQNENVALSHRLRDLLQTLGLVWRASPRHSVTYAADQPDRERAARRQSVRRQTAAGRGGPGGGRRRDLSGAADPAGHSGGAGRARQPAVYSAERLAATAGRQPATQRQPPDSGQGVGPERGGLRERRDLRPSAAGLPRGGFAAPGRGDAAGGAGRGRRHAGVGGGADGPAGRCGCCRWCCWRACRGSSSATASAWRATACCAARRTTPACRTTWAAC